MSRKIVELGDHVISEDGSRWIAGLLDIVVSQQCLLRKNINVATALVLISLTKASVMICGAKGFQRVEYQSRDLKRKA
jgi:hypothetical protein